jgi:hypothetical protein
MVIESVSLPTGAGRSAAPFQLYGYQNYIWDVCPIFGLLLRTHSHHRRILLCWHYGLLIFIRNL